MIGSSHRQGKSYMCQNQFSDRQRPAFTVLELLVVVSVIGMLVGLLIPALMAARESARRLQCTNNLHEIGLAIHQYHDTKRRLPEAWTEASDGVSGYGWAVALLPFLEEPELQRAIHCKLDVSAAQNDTPRNTDLTIMRCPSDISESSFELHPEHEHTESSTAESSDDDSTTLARLPTANYMGVFGTLEADETFPAPAGDGPIVARRAVHYADLERGQSHTLRVGERPTSMVPSTWFGVNFQGEDAACRLVGSAITTPNCDSCDECEFGSRHSGGANFAWADGHVCLLPDDIDPIAYQCLAKRQML
jgi:prepilin-type processing-associated H-X9-DG protein